VKTRPLVFPDRFVNSQRDKKHFGGPSGPYPSRGAAGPVQQLISKGKSYEAVCVSSWRVNPSGIKGQNRRNGGATLRPAVRHNGRHEKSCDNVISIYSRIVGLCRD